MSNNTVNKALPVAPYIGGKRNLAGRIVERIGRIPHTLYAEPFVGMGGVFLRRPTPAKAEVINDLNGEVANFFRVLQRHYVFFMEMMRFQITTRAEFDRLTRTDPTTLSDLERAARFLYLQRTAFGGKVDMQAFGVGIERPARFDISKLAPMLDALHTRLTSVTIECLPYRDFILKYDRRRTLFYLDPPYYGNETDYGKGMFSREDFEALADLLAGIKGSFILSLNDVAPVRKIFTGFTIDSVRTSYSIGAKMERGKQFRELIISN